MTWAAQYIQNIVLLHTDDTSASSEKSESLQKSFSSMKCCLVDKKWRMTPSPVVKFLLVFVTAMTVGSDTCPQVGCQVFSPNWWWWFALSPITSRIQHKHYSSKAFNWKTFSNKTQCIQGVVFTAWNSKYDFAAVVTESGDCRNRSRVTTDVTGRQTSLLGTNRGQSSQKRSRVTRAGDL